MSAVIDSITRKKDHSLAGLQARSDGNFETDSARQAYQAPGRHAIHVDVNSPPVAISKESAGRHPDSPNGEALTRLVISAAEILPGIRTQSWDVALAAEGPVLLEVNYGGDLNLTQLAHGAGVLDERLHRTSRPLRLPHLSAPFWPWLGERAA